MTALRVRAAITGDLREIVKAENQAARRATRRAVRARGRAARARFQRAIASANLGRLGRAIKVRNFSTRSPLGAAAFVYAKGPAANDALEAFETGVTIRARNARVLLIATTFNRAGGRRGGRVLIAPDKLDGAFWQRSKAGNLFLFGKPQRATRAYGRQRGQEVAFIGGRLLGSGRRRRTRDILAARSVPMFRAVENVTIRRRLNLRAIAERERSLLVGDVVREWERESGR